MMTANESVDPGSFCCEDAERNLTACRKAAFRGDALNAWILVFVLGVA